MSDTSARLDLPLLQPSQAQKHVTHNEALLILDIATQLVVDAFDADVAPTSPEDGSLYALSAAPQGVWVGQGGKLALWSDTQWRFFEAKEGWRAGLAGSAQVFVRQGGAWVAQQIATQNLDSIGINATGDSINRLAVSAAQTLFSHDGAGHRVTLNKAGISDSAEIVFQTNWAGRAVFALDTGDALNLKLSADGSAWVDAITWDPASGHMGVGVANPERPVHISDALRLEPGTAPANPVAGDLYFDAGTSRLRCHDGSAWRNLF